MQFYHLTIKPIGSHLIPLDSDSPLSFINTFSSFLHEFDDVFSTLKGFPPTREQDHHIFSTSQWVPISISLLPEIWNWESGGRDDGRRHNPAKHLPLLLPILLVKKKDDTWRFCVDYLALNAVIVKDRFLIPMVDELLDEIADSCIFSKLDQHTGYHQIWIHSNDVEKIVFCTHEGHYEFLVMSFSLTNAPSTFQSLMNMIFRQVLRKFVLIFFNGILVYNPD